MEVPFLCGGCSVAARHWALRLDGENARLGCVGLGLCLSVLAAQQNSWGVLATHRRRAGRDCGIEANPARRLTGKTRYAENSFTPRPAFDCAMT